MSYLARRFGFYLVTAWAAITMNFFIPTPDAGQPGRDPGEPAVQLRDR